MRTFARHFMMSTRRPASAQKILGHATPAITMRYPHLATGHLRKAMDALSFSTSSAHDAKIGAERAVSVDAPVAQVDRATVS